MDRVSRRSAGQEMIDPASFIQERSRAENERKRLEALATRYRAGLPTITAHWDLRPEGVQHNDINKKDLAGGMLIYKCSMDDLWNGLYDPRVYEANTIWKASHVERKIVRVIEAWEKGALLSPLFLVKHKEFDLGLVADGKHRLTVCRAIRASEVPFMVVSADAAWVEKVIPCAERIDHRAPEL